MLQMLAALLLLLLLRSHLRRHPFRYPLQEGLQMMCQTQEEEESVRAVRRRESYTLRHQKLCYRQCLQALG
jgi:hypothetical protein